MFSPSSSNQFQYQSRRLNMSAEKTQVKTYNFDDQSKKTTCNMKLVLKKPIQELINEGLFSKTFYEKPLITKNNDLRNRHVVHQNLTFENSQTKTRISNLINDSKQLINQGSKFLLERRENNSNQEPSNSEFLCKSTKSVYQEENVNRMSYENQPKKDAYKEFLRLENKLKDLEGKISALKTKRNDYISSSASKTRVYNPTQTEQRSFTAISVHNPDEYTNVLKSMVTQVQPKSLFPQPIAVDPIITNQLKGVAEPAKPINNLPQRSQSQAGNRKKTNRYFVDSVIEAFTSPTAVNREMWLDYISQTLQCMHFLNSFSIPRDISRNKLITLPKSPYYFQKKTLIFDLDETLVHCNESADLPCDVILNINFGIGLNIDAGINLRPFARESLWKLAKYFEILVFTASNINYAQSVVNFLDPNQEVIQHSLSREQCIFTNDGFFIKDLRILGNRNLEDVILVDNAPYSFGLQVNNGIPILPFYNDKNDKEMIKLTDFLIGIADCNDVRTKISDFFKLERFTEFKDPIELVNNLFRKEKF